MTGFVKNGNRPIHLLFLLNYNWRWLDRTTMV